MHIQINNGEETVENVVVGGTPGGGLTLFGVSKAKVTVTLTREEVRKIIEADRQFRQSEPTTPPGT